VQAFVEQALPELDPVIYHEPTDYGWRGLTQQGEVLEVRGTNGHTIEVPSEIIVAHAGVPIGRRKVSKQMIIDIDNYLMHFNRGVDHYKANRIDDALLECDLTLVEAPTLRAKFNRAMILLAAGRWAEGLDEYWQCEQEEPFMRPQVRDALTRGMWPWQGERLSGRKLVVLHAHGFGDTIMMLRYLPALYALGAKVVIDVPEQVQRLTTWPQGYEGDYFCPFLHLLRMLAVTPQTVDSSPYIAVNAVLANKWRSILERKTKRVGIAWSIGKPSLGDYPREIPLGQLVAAFPDAEIHSVQIQNAREASQFGVHVHDLEDFADCAALMMQMDTIVSVDTAALHLAGAIGHPRVFGLLSNWASWRWLAPWYSNVKLCRQAKADDWKSALEEIHRY
jgi:hypothetical protein